MDRSQLLRIGARSAGVALRATRRAVDRALDATDRIAGPSNDPDLFAGASVAAPPEVVTEPEPVDAEVVADAHVSEDAELVDSQADPGAQDGAGAEIRVDEPWEGYTAMNAVDVIARLGHSSAAELGAVELYESTHRARKTVLEAVRREFKKPRPA